MSEKSENKRSTGGGEEGPLEEQLFDGMFGRPVHHYLLWGLVIAAAVAGFWALERYVLRRPPSAPSALSNRPTSLALDIQCDPEGLTVRNKMDIPITDGQMIVVPDPNYKYELRITDLQPGKELRVLFKDFRDRNGYGYQYKLMPASKVTVNAFGLKAEKELPLPAASTASEAGGEKKAKGKP